MQFDITPPDGYEFTGEWRRPEAGEPFMAPYGNMLKCREVLAHGCYPILRKKETLKEQMFNILDEAVTKLKEEDVLITSIHWHDNTTLIISTEERSKV